MIRLLFALLFAAGEALAEGYPDRPARIIVGYPPDKQEKATQTVLEQAEVLCGTWAVA